jgi:hypothetical protein
LVLAAGQVDVDKISRELNKTNKEIGKLKAVSSRRFALI